MDCLVEYDYVPQEDDELAIRKGDIIQNASLSEEGWLRGELNGKMGLFPDNFVKIIGKSNVNNYKDRTSTISPMKLARVLHPYVASVKDELDLKLNSYVEILHTGEPGWLKARADGKIGWIPSNFVRLCSPAHAHQNKEKNDPNLSHAVLPIPEQLQRLKNLHSEIISTKLTDNIKYGYSSQSNVDTINEGPELALVKFAYRAANPDELNLEVGDVVLIIDKEGEDSGWWKGELNGKTGVFPDNFVELLPRSMQVEKESGRYADDAKGDKNDSPNATPKQKLANNSPDKSTDLSQKSTNVNVRNSYLDSLGVYTRPPVQPNHIEPASHDQESDVLTDSNVNYNELVKFFQSNNAVLPLARPSSTNTQYESVTDRILKGLATAAKNASDGTGFTVYNTKSNTLRALDEKTLHALMCCIGNSNRDDDRRTSSACPETQHKHSVSTLPPACPQSKSCPPTSLDNHEFNQRKRQLETQQLQWRQPHSMSSNKISANQLPPTPTQRNNMIIQPTKRTCNNGDVPGLKSGDMAPTKPFVPNFGNSSVAKSSGMCSGDGPRYCINSKSNNAEEINFLTDKITINSKDDLGCIEGRDTNEYALNDQTNQVEESLTNAVLGDMRRQMKDLKKQMDSLKESLVPRRDFELLRKEVENLRKVFTSRLQSILDEIDEEKKSRLNERLESSRLK